MILRESERDQHGDNKNNDMMRTLALPLALMAFIGVLSSIPGTDDGVPTFLGLVPPTLQNLLHIPLFGLLAYSWARTLTRLGNGVALALAAAGVIAFGWGVLDEWHQLYVPGRYGSLTDVLLDGVGVACGLLVFYRARRGAHDLPPLQ